MAHFSYTRTVAHRGAGEAAEEKVPRKAHVADRRLPGGARPLPGGGCGGVIGGAAQNKVAVEAEEAARWRMVTAQAAVEVWRSMEASNRGMDRGTR